MKQGTHREGKWSWSMELPAKFLSRVPLLNFKPETEYDMKGHHMVPRLTLIFAIILYSIHLNILVWDLSVQCPDNPLRFSMQKALFFKAMLLHIQYFRCMEKTFGVSTPLPLFSYNLGSVFQIGHGMGVKSSTVSFFLHLCLIKMGKVWKKSKIIENDSNAPSSFLEKMN